VGRVQLFAGLLAREGIAEEIKDVAARGSSSSRYLCRVDCARKGRRRAGRKRLARQLLGIMDIKVNRNAFGRQRDSFETELKVEILDSPFRGVFIRAPGIVNCGPECECVFNS
jgi:5'-phosphate synthase pdxT subunit